MKYLLSLIFSIVFCCASAAAQDQPAQPQKPPKENGSEKTPEKIPDLKRPKTAKDLDAFFKEGERQAKDGPRCETPPAPTV